MYLKLDAVFNSEGESVSFDYEFPLDSSSVLTPVRVKGSVFNRTGMVRLQASAEFDYSAVCDRCGRPLQRRAEVRCEHNLLSHAENEDDDGFIVLNGMGLDLDGLVREDIYLAAPAKILCREDCKGLCSICGADLNVTQCGCKKPADARFDILREMFGE